MKLSPSTPVASAAQPSPFDPRDTPLPASYFEKKYHLSRTTLWRYRRAGLRAVSVGSKLFVKESDFVAFVQRMDGSTASAAPLKTSTKETP